MADELDILKLVAERLEAAGLRYMVGGSMAINFYAQPRMTRDIDIVVELDVGDAERLASLFVADFYCEVDAVRDAAERRGMFHIIHNETVVKVDFIVRKDFPYRAEEMRRRRLVDAGGARIWLVAPEDLLLSKLYWARDSRSELQLRDARNLIASQAGLDWPYIETWAQELSISDLLAEVRA